MPRFDIQSFHVWIGRPLGSAFLTSLQKLWASPARKSLFQKTRRKSSSEVPGRLPALNKVVVFCFAGLRTALRGMGFTSDNRNFTTRLILMVEKRSVSRERKMDCWLRDF